MRKQYHKRIIGFDTLKFIAIALIVVYHCFPGVLPGGFLAVEIFFVISGFLMAQKLFRLKNKEKTHFGKPKSFFKFLWDRLKRFLPTLLFCMILTLSLAFFADPDLLTAARPNSLYAITFSTNIASIINGSTYENSLIPNLFNQTWFLALELQICILFFLIIASSVQVFSPKKSKNQKPQISLIVFCLAIGIASFLLMVAYGGWFNLYDRAYFGLDSHIGSFFIGAALAMFTMRQKTKPTRKYHWPWWLLAIISISGIIIMTPFIHYESSEAFIFALPLTCILSCLTIFSIIKLQPIKNNSAPRILKPFEYLGSISFPIYLFHWGLYIVLPSLLSFWPLEIIPYIAIAISIILAILLQKVIMPFSTKHKIIFSILLLLSLILPIWSLIKAPEKSSIEENLIEAAADMPSMTETEKIAVDYSGITAFATLLNNDVMQFFDASKDFAKPYPVAVRSNGGVYNPSARAYYNTPDYGRTSSLNSARIMVLGDSVVLGATNAIYNTVPSVFVDAMQSRNMTDAINLLAGYRAANGGSLPYIIVIGLVTNYYPFGVDTLSAIMEAAGPGHQFVFITGYCGDYPRDSQNNTIKWMANNYGNVHVGDWVPIVLSNVDYYTYADHTHLTPAGRQAYADLVYQATRGL